MQGTVVGLIKGDTWGCSQNYEPLLVVDYITAPNTQSYPNGTLILGATHMQIFHKSRRAGRPILTTKYSKP